MWFPGVTSQCHADNACLMLVAQTLTEVSFSGFSVGCCETTLLFIALYAMIHVIGGQRSVRIAPPSLSPHHSGPATRDFQPFISVEVLL